MIKYTIDMKFKAIKKCFFDFLYNAIIMSFYSKQIKYFTSKCPENWIASSELTCSNNISPR